MRLSQKDRLMGQLNSKRHEPYPNLLSCVISEQIHTASAVRFAGQLKYSTASPLCCFDITSTVLSNGFICFACCHAAAQHLQSELADFNFS